MHPSSAALVSDEARLFFPGKLIVFTSFYDYRGHASYTRSMVALSMLLERLGVRWDYWPYEGDFHIERVVNAAFSRFLEDEEATHILCIDSDESFDPSGVLRMLEHDVEIVSAAYKMKNKWDVWTSDWLVNKETGQPVGIKVDPVKKTALLEANRVAWGFTLFSKKALQKYVAKFPELWFNLEGKKTPIFCELRYIDHGLFSQDYGMSERMKEAGVKLYIEPDVTIGHWGNVEFKGNLRDWLIQLAESQKEGKESAESLGANADAAQAFAVIHQMAREIKERKAA